MRVWRKGKKGRQKERRIETRQIKQTIFKKVIGFHNLKYNYAHNIILFMCLLCGGTCVHTHCVMVCI